MSHTTTKYRADIDGLRAIAILSVVVFHAFPSVLTGGFVGVDIFFVISGFLITSILVNSLERDKFTFFDFYCRRIKRIFPALLIVLLSILLYGWFFLLGDDYCHLGKNVAGGAGFISNYLLWRESGYFDTASVSKPLLHLWSLAIEEQFYIFWPFLLWLVHRRRLNLVKLIVIVGLISFTLSIAKIHTDKIAAFYSPQTRFWELMAGACLACITLNEHRYINIKKWIDPNAQSFIGVMLLAISIYVINENKMFPGTWATLPVLGTVLIISAGQQAFLNRNFFSNRILVWIGLISYPLYLWHWPLLSLAHISIENTPSITIRIAIIFLSVILAWLTYKLIETPLKAKNIVFPLVFAMILGGAIGFVIYDKNGFPNRFQGLESIDVAGNEFGHDWKMHTCFLQLDQGDKLFPDRNLCIEKRKHNIFLWGDSFAAALYPGLNFLERSKGFGVAYFAANSCPPLLGWNNPSRAFLKK
jgi:peptidoglycan/LPS O-acetylase OafA/YrhL